MISLLNAGDHDCPESWCGYVIECGCLHANVMVLCVHVCVFVYVQDYAESLQQHLNALSKNLFLIWKSVLTVCSCTYSLFNYGYVGGKPERAKIEQHSLANQKALVPGYSIQFMHVCS